MSLDYVDFESVKKPKDDLPLTPEEEAEFIKCKNDIIYWCTHYVYVQGPGGKVLFDPRPYQRRALEAFEVNNFTILKIPRQAGKSTVVSIYFLHKAVFFSDERIGITSYKLANVKDVMDRIKFSYENLPHWMKPAVLEYNRYTIRFNNDNTITSQVTKENTFRGLSLTLVFLDELAHVKPLVAEEFWTGLLPSITAGGNESTAKLIIASTPNGSGGLFAQLWFDAVSGKNGFAHVDCPYDEIPGRDESYKQKMLKKMSINRWLQEYECCDANTVVTIQKDGAVTDITIGDLYGLRLKNKFNGNMRTNTDHIMIKTPNGFVPFAGVAKRGVKDIFRVQFKEGHFVDVSQNHIFFLHNGDEVKCKDLIRGTSLKGEKRSTVESVTFKERNETFDIIQSQTGNYYTNGVLSHNCHFISDKGTLVNSRTIESLRHNEPVREIGDLSLFTDSFTGKTIAMAIDVSDGVGKDYHAIQLFDISKIEQVGEFRNNFLTQTEFVKEIIKIFKFLFDAGVEDIYYTVENNGTGKGVIALLINSSNPVVHDCNFISDKDGNQVGFMMTRKSKPYGCMKLKDLLESGKMTIHSERLINELKFFVKKANSFAAESGMNDDLVMATVLMCLLLNDLGDFEESLYDTFNEVDIDLDEEGFDVGVYF